jgi:rhodanese-related sulfurtransferase
MAGKALRKSSRQLVEEASARIETLSAAAAARLLNDDSVLFVDIRDVRELQRSGTIPGAFHAPRGMLEFWVDPESPYFKPVFGEYERFLLFCQSSWRSALSTMVLSEMGMDGVAHIGGGFSAWSEAGHPVAPYERPAEREAGS